MAAAPFDWTEYLRLANDLSSHADEAAHRTSISRAYYSVYHAATLQATRNGYTGASHADLWKVFARETDRSCRKLAQMGNTMKRMRTNADYKALFPKVPDQMAQQLVDAQTFMTRLAALPLNVPRP